MKTSKNDVTETMKHSSLPDDKFHDMHVIGLIGYWLPLILYAGTITLISSLSTPKIHLENFSHAFFSVPVGVFTSIDDTLYHLVEYTILGLLMYRAIRFTWGMQLGTFSAFLAVCLVTVFGLMDEFHQWFTPLRQMEAQDLMADTLGGLFGVMLWEWALSFPLIQHLEAQLPSTLRLSRSRATEKF